jgi:hypothetical protein
VIATRAVATSIARIAESGTHASSRAARGGIETLAIPRSAWLVPATRARCRSGTMSVVEACMAGQWNAAPRARTNIGA